jgi:hypothetical protein
MNSASLQYISTCLKDTEISREREKKGGRVSADTSMILILYLFRGQCVSFPSAEEIHLCIYVMAGRGGDLFCIQRLNRKDINSWEHKHATRRTDRQTDGTHLSISV